MFENMTEEQKNAFSKMAAEMHKATEEAMNEAFKVSGWHYRDIRWTKTDILKNILSLIGEDNYKIIISSECNNWDNIPFSRGQFLISPQGLENIKDWKSSEL